MNGFLSHLFFQCLAVALLYARHLVIAASVQLVVGNGRGRSIEMIQRNRLIRIRKRFNTQRANELQGINKQIRETITRKVNSVDELKTQSASLIAKIKKLNNDDLINELETDYNVLCKQIKQTEQEISELNGQIAENDAEIKRNVEQKDFSKMEQSALYKEKLQKAVYHSLSAMRGILEIIFKNGMTRYVLIKKHRNGGTYLLPDTFKGDMERKQIIVPSLRTDKDNPYSAQPMNLRYTFDEFFKAMPVEEYEIPITE